jgi:iron complex transport system ATP-binding protein
MIEAHDVSVAVGAVTLVDHASVRAAPGDLVAVIGPNGAGKSTLLRVLAGDLRPTSGTVTVDRTAIDELDIPTRAMTRAVFTPDSGGAVPFSVWDVAMMGRHPKRRDPNNSAATDSATVRHALERMDVADLADRVHATLSSGERTRVALARVLAQDAPVLLLDEPTTALDVGHEVLVMRAIRMEADAGRAVVAVLHDLNAAARFATSVVAMDRGRIVAAGAPTNVLNGPLLTEIYGHPMQVLPHPLGGGVLVVPAVVDGG